MSEVTDANTRASKDDTKFPAWLYVFFGAVVLLVVFLLGLYFSEFNKGYGWGSQEKFAQFGDFVGGTLNPILGFATVALLIWSIRLQMAELKDTREEIKGSRKALENQVEHLRNEAKLNEVTRLLNIQKNKYEELMKKPFRNGDEEIRILRFHMESSFPLTIGDIINKSYLNKSIESGPLSKLYELIWSDYKSSDCNGLHWSKLEHVALTIGGLTHSYLKLSEGSHEFTMVYLRESHQILADVYSVLETEVLYNGKQKLNNLLDDDVPSREKN
ncbi:MAG: hypothetical protein HRU23_19060 [Gammaproteobacteria bacterium]|nr:hypothetical protein [Gammaproteobacteria bacterium]